MAMSSIGASKTMTLNPVIMMTGFGYDPKHSIGPRQVDGLKDVLY
jgi:hypothetical protein